MEHNIKIYTTITKYKYVNLAWTLLFAVMLLQLVGCNAMHTAVKKRDLRVQTKMSDSVFLDPVSQEKRTVFLQLRNTSDKQGLVIETEIKTALSAKGYEIVHDPDNAHFWIQANILKAGITTADENKGILSQGYGGALAGAVVGAQFGSGNGQGAATLLGAAAGFVADSLIEDVYFNIVTDLQVSERAKSGVKIQENNQAKLKQGNSGYKSVTSNEITDRKKYQTRIVSTANKVNLKFAEAEPQLIRGLVNSISGLL
ncbi:complement resistance protein TraT [Pseudoalteromonas aurantia]|uniref:Complement resistance protein TraT n=1 Tax=Pseudoalteromonas aurantia TaxID=43654 RepID=A0ABY2VZZ0_9GAMM|nr:complement resistance protein TraT [Pseudoalteromonas aurantia]TMO60653.1 complement resistance protein TraT [Pseudoalteromonas aurantia]TMO76078.1 complement resistance protein TraT [Pseudoalteromonas aurantia]